MRLPFDPGHTLNDHVVASSASHAPHAIQEYHSNVPERNELAPSFGKSIVDWSRMPAYRAYG
jgi:hypothetical protein